MDSLTQIALGSAVGIAVMRRRTATWKAALWGGICGTLPDLDSLIDHGDPISNMTFHRAESHALFYLTLASVPIAWLVSRISGEADRFGRWWLALWLVLITHPLLDVMTVYGTQLALPFTDHPYAVGSIFIIDPLYTLPLLIGVIAALVADGRRGLRWNAIGLGLSTAYLAWSVVAQQVVLDVARESLQAQGIPARKVLVTPAPFNTLLWRVVAITPGGYVEGFRSLLDDEPHMQFNHFRRDEALFSRLQDNWHVARIAWFSHGFFKMEEHDGQVTISDLRMGMEPYYSFTFVVARRNSARLSPVSPLLIEDEDFVDVGAVLRWLWRRMRGEILPPPRPEPTGPA